MNAVHTEDRTAEAEAQKSDAPAAKAPKQHPCLCSKLSALVNVREGEHGDLVWDEEHSTGCDPEILTSKTFRPGHDAKAISFLLEAHAHPEWDLHFGSVATSPGLVAEQLGDALAEKFKKAADNFDKKEAEKAERARERAARREAAKQAKAEQVEAALAEADSHGEQHNEE